MYNSNKIRLDLRTKLFEAQKILNEWQNIADKADEELEKCNESEKYGFVDCVSAENLCSLNEIGKVKKDKLKAKIIELYADICSL
jgi:hypothetical protein